MEVHLPRSIERGPVEAFARPVHRDLVVPTFRAQLSAAPLKRCGSAIHDRPEISLPRSIERGPVEAMVCTEEKLAEANLPRSIERGPVEASWL